MTPKCCFLSLAAITLASPALHAASPANLDQEYQQVRKIALRDPKVKAAYEEADRKLEAKIVQIDPTLASYQHHRSSEAPPTAVAASKVAPAPTAGGFHTTHTVTKGETLGGIASHYGVTVAALTSANHIVDAKKLAIGQVLNIPAASAKKAN